MTEYISREAAVELLKKRLYETALNSTGFNADAGDVFADAAERLEKTWINEIPAADVRPVVRGKWNAYNNTYVCSACGRPISFWKSNFCPNCGAMMEESDEIIST